MGGCRPSAPFWPEDILSAASRRIGTHQVGGSSGNRRQGELRGVSKEESFNERVWREGKPETTGRGLRVQRSSCWLLAGEA